MFVNCEQTVSQNGVINKDFFESWSHPRTKPSTPILMLFLFWLFSLHVQMWKKHLLRHTFIADIFHWMFFPMINFITVKKISFQGRIIESYRVLASLILILKYLISSSINNFIMILCYRLLVGAPEAESGQPNIRKGGAVYRCPPDAPGRCELIEFDSKGNFFEKIKIFIWLDSKKFSTNLKCKNFVFEWLNSNTKFEVKFWFLWEVITSPRLKIFCGLTIKPTHLVSQKTVWNPKPRFVSLLWIYIRIWRRCWK